MTSLLPIARDRTRPGPTRGLSLTAYAKAKNLPASFLRGLGLSDDLHFGAAAVRVPYRNESGAESAIRYRVALNGKSRFYWRKGDKPLPYGLDRLAEGRAAGFITLCEGESDTQTLWLNKEPSLGIPGAAMWREAWADHLGGIESIFLVVEPGAGGAMLANRLAASPLRGRLRLIRLKPHKDVSDLYCDEPGAFRSRWEAAKSASVEPTDPGATTVRARFGTLDDLGWVALPWGALRFRKAMGLTYAEFVVVLALLESYRARDEWCSISQTILAERTGLSRQRVVGLVARLRDKGLLAVRPDPRYGFSEAGGKHTFFYCLQPYLAALSAYASGSPRPSDEQRQALAFEAEVALSEFIERLRVVGWEWRVASLSTLSGDSPEAMAREFGARHEIHLQSRTIGDEDFLAGLLRNDESLPFLGNTSSTSVGFPAASPEAAGDSLGGVCVGEDGR